MATETFVNIKELPEIDGINEGDYLIVETPNGTSILNFDNFIITKDNVTFASLLSTDSNNYTDTRINSLSSTINAEFDKVYYGKCTVNIINNTTAQAVLVPAPVTAVLANSILTTDVMITPANLAAANAGAYISAVAKSASTNDITVTIGTSGVSSQTLSFNCIVFKPY
jgi:hypothetical protein